MTTSKYDCTKRLVNRLRDHKGIECTRISNSNSSEFVYLLEFSESSDRQGIEDIINSFRSWMSDDGYDADYRVSTYDDQSNYNTRKVRNLDENQRLLVLEF